MRVLATEGFDNLVADAAERAGAVASAGAAARRAATLGGAVPWGVAEQAMTRAERYLLGRVELAGATTAAWRDDDRGDRLALDGRGRLLVLRSGEPTPQGARPVAAVDWGTRGRPAGLDHDLDTCARVEAVEHAELRDWLVGLDLEEALARLRRVREALRRMAPVVLHVGRRTFTNLGADSNLVGKSVRPDSPACALHRMERSDRGEWPTAEAVLVVGVHALVSSGPEVRIEEFNGTQLRLGRLEEFLRDRVAAYGGRSPQRDGDAPAGAWLERLAGACAQARRAAARCGAVFYRHINGPTLHKSERLLPGVVAPGRLPPEVARVVWPEGVPEPPPASWAAVDRELAGRLLPLDAPDGDPDRFPSRLEGLVHQVVEAATAAIRSDVGMSRGPRDVAACARTARGLDTAALDWRTADFFCCVVPAEAFVARLAEHPGELRGALKAIAARMRYNGWHYLPDSLGLTRHCPERDYFYAPAMADITDWSDRHHRGHVLHGVRQAIRAPFPLTLGGRDCTGLYDLRLMRVDGPGYTAQELVTALAVARLLRSVYQVNADTPAGSGGAVAVSAFDNSWFDAYAAAGAHARR